MQAAELPVEVPRKVWTRDDAHALVDLGFPNASRLELVEGELIDRMGKKRAHVIYQTLIQTWLTAVFGSEHVQTEAPIDVAAEDNNKNEPEPDLAVTYRSTREYKTNPGPKDLQLIIEISDSTLDFDLHKKARLYARAAIIEYWVIDISNRRVHVHRQPVNGAYTAITSHRFSEELTPLSQPQHLFCMARL